MLILIGYVDVCSGDSVSSVLEDGGRGCLVSKGVQRGGPHEKEYEFEQAWVEVQ